MSELRKKFCEKPPSLPLEKIFACRQRGAKMTKLRKISVKNLRTYQPLSKIFLVPIKGVLKWLSYETISVKNLRPYPVEIFLRTDKGDPKMIELRKNSVKNLRLYHLPIEKMFSC